MNSFSFQFHSICREPTNGWWKYCDICKSQVWTEVMSIMPTRCGSTYGSRKIHQPSTDESYTDTDTEHDLLIASTSSLGWSPLKSVRETLTVTHGKGFRMWKVQPRQKWQKFWMYRRRNKVLQMHTKSLFVRNARTWIDLCSFWKKSVPKLQHKKEKRFFLHSCTGKLDYQEDCSWI